MPLFSPSPSFDLLFTSNISRPTQIMQNQKFPCLLKWLTLTYSATFLATTPVTRVGPQPSNPLLTMFWLIISLIFINGLTCKSTYFSNSYYHVQRNLDHEGLQKGLDPRTFSDWHSSNCPLYAKLRIIDNKYWGEFRRVFFVFLP